MNMEKDKYSRRKFLARLTGAAAIGLTGIPIVAAAQFIYPPASMTKLPDPMKVAGINELSVGSVHTFAYNNAAAALIRISDKEYKAFNLKCTHLGCTTHWSEADKLFECPCHWGEYDENGKVVAGPPPRPLVELSVIIKQDTIWVQERSV